MSTQFMPNTPKGLATRQRLLDAARLVAVNSQGAIEIAAVAAEAGVVQSLINKYFGSKTGLVCALIDQFYEEFCTEVFDDKVAVDLKQVWSVRERRRLEAGIRFHYAEPLAIVMYGSLALEPEAAQRHAEHTRAMISRGARSIRNGQKRGELPLGVDPGIASAAMFGAMRQVIVEALSRKSRPSQRSLVNTLWRHVSTAVQLDQ